jgi:hypothetical protein
MVFVVNEVAKIAFFLIFATTNQQKQHETYLIFSVCLVALPCFCTIQ